MKGIFDSNISIVVVELYSINLNCGDKNMIQIRLFQNGDEKAVSDVIRSTLRISSSKDYPADFIQKNIDSHSPEIIRQRAKDSHFYVAVDDDNIIGCGGITGYWGSSTESYILSVFVLPQYQGKGVGRSIVETLETDDYFQRAWRTEIGASITAVDFYRHMGYTYKNSITTPDEYGTVRMEKKVCPCKRTKCPRHNNCDACREHHHNDHHKKITRCEKLQEKEQKRLKEGQNPQGN